MAGFKAERWIRCQRRRIMETEITSKKLKMNKERRIMDLGRTKIKELDKLTKEKVLELNVKDYYEEINII